MPASKFKEAIKPKEDSNEGVNIAAATTHTGRSSKSTTVPPAAGHFTFDEDEKGDTAPKYKETEEKEKLNKDQQQDLISPYDKSEEHKHLNDSKQAKSNPKPRRSRQPAPKLVGTASQHTPPRRGRVDPNKTVDNDGDNVESGLSNQQLREQEDDENIIGSGNTTVWDRAKEN
jgi:hypothetical protein